MKTKALLVIVLFTLPMSISAQRMTSFETGWKFHRNGVINAEMPDCDDSSWRTVTLPHDFSLEPSMTIRDSRVSLEEWDNVQEGPFTRLNIGNSDQGHIPGGEGWYRKTFRLPLAAGQSLDDYLSKNEVSIQFDGVYNNAEVSIAVRSLNVDHNSRWYSGSGIFRRVWLITTGKQHLNQWDVFVDGSEVTAKKGANGRSSEGHLSSLKDGRVVTDEDKVNGMPNSISFHTAKAPAAIQMQPLRPCITASHHDLAYIYLDVVDEDGNLCPTAELPLKVESSGAKHIATCGTGHPSDMKSFRTLTPKSFRGKAVIIIQPQDETGEVTIKVTSPNLKSAEYKLRITK